jgi:hypothetical protein
MEPGLTFVAVVAAIITVMIVDVLGGVFVAGLTALPLVARLLLFAVYLALESLLCIRPAPLLLSERECLRGG